MERTGGLPLPPSPLRPLARSGLVPGVDSAGFPTPDVTDRGIGLRQLVPAEGVGLDSDPLGHFLPAQIMRCHKRLGLPGCERTVTARRHAPKHMSLHHEGTYSWGHGMRTPPVSYWPGCTPSSLSGPQMRLPSSTHDQPRSSSCGGSAWAAARGERTEADAITSAASKRREVSVDVCMRQNTTRSACSCLHGGRVILPLRRYTAGGLPLGRGQG